MNKKRLSLILLSTLLIAGYVPIAVADNPLFPASYDPTHAVVDTIGEPETVDPAWGYDSSSGELIFNVYETLIFYDNVMTDGPYTAGKADRFKPMLATDVNILPGPGDHVKTFYFKIRGVGSVHTFVPATGVTLFDETDQDYGKVGRQKSDVSEVNVPDRQYTGVGSPMDTTWSEGGTEWVLRGWSDNDASGDLSVGDDFDMVREGKNGPKGPWWNVREYWTVGSIDGSTVSSTDPPVYFHNGVALTPADVEYSFERAFVQDRSGGPTWMLWYPTQGLYSALSPGDDPNFGPVIDDMVGSDSTYAWISLRTDFPETTFLQILSQSWSSIVNKAWCVAKGDFDGNWAAGWETIYDTWHAPATSFIEGDMMGTGPYTFSYWEEGTAYSIVRNTNYWDGWPALVTATGKGRIGGYLDRVSWFLKTNWDDRRARFLAGDADFTDVPRQYKDQILGQIVGGDEVRCFYPVEPKLTTDAVFFNFDISPFSPYLGPGFDAANPYTIAQDRIPVDLFSDPHMRDAFRSAFDYDTFLAAAYLGEATQPSDPIVPGLSYDNVGQARPSLDWVRAEQELQLAWGGEIWEKGMSFTLLYNAGNVARETAVTILMNNINAMNSEFHLSVAEVPWGSTYLPQMVARMLPLFSIGWLADYPDPDNFAFPFMYSQGTFSQWQSYSNPRVDALIEAGALWPDDINPYNGELDYPDPRPYFNNPGGIPPDTVWQRRSIYYELQALYVEDNPGFCLSQAVGRDFQQAWIRGWYYNPLYPGNYFYHLWKATSHYGDVNNDGFISLVDSAGVSASWTKPSPSSTLGPLGYRPQADVTGGMGGTWGGGVGLVVGIPDGRVGIADVALVSAYWDGPPTGPSEPSTQSITVTGSFESAEESGTPILQAKVKLYDKDDAPNADDLLASGTTGTSGTFSLGPVVNIDGDTADQGALDVYVVIEAASNFVQVNDGDTTSIWTFKTDTVTDVASGTHDFGRVTITGDSAKAFKIYTSMGIGVRYVQNKVGGNPSLIVRWCPGYDKATAYSRDTDTIYIQDRPTDTDWDDRGVHLHEFGHYVSDWKHFLPPPAPDWPETHQWWDDGQPEAFAWKEAWAHFFSRAAVSWVLGSEEATYRDYNSAGYIEYNLESGEANDHGTPHPAGSLGSDNEGSVAATLWDIFDDHNDATADNGVDTLARSDGDIWDVVLNYQTGGHGVYTVIDFREGWFAKGHDARDEVNAILNLHGIPQQP